MNKPAPVNNNNDSATWATISALVKRDTAPVVRRLCLSAVVKSVFVARHAGARPNSKTVSSDTARVNTSTRQFRVKSTPLGKIPVSLSVSASSALLPQNVQHTHTAPPNSDSHK